MSHVVDEKINITPIPLDDREECLVKAFNSLEPGQTLQVIDDFNPEWIRALLESRCDCKLGAEGFEVRKNAGRFLVMIRKPDSSEHESNALSSRLSLLI